MRTAHNPSPVPNVSPVLKHENRRHGRLRCRYLDVRHRSRFMGTVLDISLSGFRVLRKGWLPLEVDEEVTMILECLESLLQVKARVVWTYKVGFRRQLVGFEFVEADKETTDAIRHLSQVAKHSLTIAD